MIKARTVLLLLPLALTACSSDDDDDTETESPMEVIDESGGSTYQMSFSNLSSAQPLTPPVVAIHDPEITLFEPGETAGDELVAVAERGDIDDLRAELAGLVGRGVASTGIPVNDDGSDGPLMPGQSASLTLTSDTTTQVLSVVSMIVCSNDGFAGINSRSLNAGVETTIAENYDAGSEINTLNRDYWVPVCGGTDNLHDDENGVIAIHPGQQPIGDDATRAFEAGAELMQVQITRN